MLSAAPGKRLITAIAPPKGGEPSLDCE